MAKKAAKKVITKKITAKNAEPGKADDSVIHPATSTQKIVLASLLAALTLVVFLIGGFVFSKVQAIASAESKVDWTRPKDVLLLPGPVQFRYDSDEEMLYFRGTMDEETKKSLVKLFPLSDDADPELKKGIDSYKVAIGKLGYMSMGNVESYIAFLLLLGGCGGVLGVQLRSLWDFIRNICYKPQLDVVTWWPWYAIRPIIGFILGVLAISLVMSGLLKVEDQSSDEILWWLSMAVLAGFGASEFTTRLRSLVAALFGEDD